MTKALDYKCDHSKDQQQIRKYKITQIISQIQYTKNKKRPCPKVATPLRRLMEVQHQGPWTCLNMENPNMLCSCLLQTQTRSWNETYLIEHLWRRRQPSINNPSLENEYLCIHR